MDVPLILTLSGEVDIAVADRLTDSWYRVAEHAEHEVIDIDLREVTFMDARGLALLVGMLNRQERHGGQLRLRRAPAPVTRLLQLIGLQEVFPVAAGPPEAAIARALAR